MEGRAEAEHGVVMLIIMQLMWMMMMGMPVFSEIHGLLAMFCGGMYIFLFYSSIPFLGENGGTRQVEHIYLVRYRGSYIVSSPTDILSDFGSYPTGQNGKLRAITRNYQRLFQKPFGFRNCRGGISSLSSI